MSAMSTSVAFFGRMLILHKEKGPPLSDASMYNYYKLPSKLEKCLPVLVRAKVLSGLQLQKGTKKRQR